MSEHDITSDKEKSVDITPAAIAEIKRLMEQETGEDIFLRIGVSAGGCSGMSYMMAFDNQFTEHDRRFDYDNLMVVVDSRALTYLSGSILDYKGGMLGGGFEFENPNAKRSCGCGSSFTC